MPVNTSAAKEPLTRKPPPSQQAPSPTVPTPTPPTGKGAELAKLEPKLPTAPVAPPAPQYEPPHPTLQKYGFNGGILQFGARTQSVVDSYTKAYGVPPSPGLVFDLARAPVDTADFEKMFEVPQSQFAATNRGTVAAQVAANPHHFLVERPDGYEQPYSPFAKGEPLGPKVAAPLKLNPNGQGWPTITPPVELKSVVAAQKFALAKMIPEGFLPVPDFHGVVNAIQQIQKYGQVTTVNDQVMIEGKPLDQFIKESQFLPKLTDTTPGNPPSYLSGDKLGSLYNLATQIKTSADGQKYLQNLAPEFFPKTLKPLGVWNATWATAVHKYQTSDRFGRDSIVSLAQANHLSAPDYISAWNHRDHLLKTQPMNYQYFRSLPLVWFASKSDLGEVGKLADYITYHQGSGSGADIVSIGLHGLENTVKLGFGLAGATINQIMADGAALNTLLVKIAPGVVGQKVSYRDAYKAAAVQLRRNPSLFRVLAPQVIPARETGTLAHIDQASTLAVLVLSGHPSVTGVKIAAGDVVGLSRNSFFNWGTRVAYNSFAKAEPIGSAVKGLEGGEAAEKLAVAAEPLIQDGSMSLAQFRGHAADLYHKGTTTIGGQTIEAGDIFRSLRNRAAPTPGLTSMAYRDVAKGLRAKLDDFEKGAQAGGLRSTTHAVDMVRNVRSLFFSRVAPENQLRGIFHATGGQRTADDIYNWTVKNIGDRNVADSLRDGFIRARAADDVSGVTKVEDRMRDLYAKKNPTATGKPAQEFEPIIKSDLPTSIYFPGKSIEARAHNINARLNQLGALHRQVIVSGAFPAPFPLPFGGGESVAWKHTVADSLRSWLGGRNLFGLHGASKIAKKDVADLMTRSNEARRAFEQASLASKEGESRWLGGQSMVDQKDFNLGDHVGDKKYEAAAGAYMRRHLNDDALNAFLKSSNKDLSPLRAHVLGDKDVREGILFRKPEYTEQLQKLETTIDRDSLVGGDIPHVTPAVKAAQQASVRQDLAAQHARVIFDRYREMEQELQKSGVNFDDAKSVVTSNPKNADKELGGWLAKNDVNLPVRKGLVKMDTKWDERMQWWVGKLMTMNKWNRGSLFEHVLYGTYSDLAKAGWDEHTALRTSIDIAHAQVRYHMLDFSNMLQVEQNLRWVSYFATKHRLYWSWIGRYFLRNPTMAAAALDASKDIGIDKYGNYNFSLGGRNWDIPMARLLWINNKEYPETSALVTGAASVAQGVALKHEGILQAVNQTFAGMTATNGNIITRSDQAWNTWRRVIGSWAGETYTFNAATTGMPATQKNQFARDLVEHAIMYEQEHGRLPSEAESVNATLLHTGFQETWAANLFVPVLPRTGTTQPWQKEMVAYQKLSAPADKAAYIESHPILSIHFGETNPDLWWHNQPLWSALNAARTELTKQKAAIWDQVNATGKFTIDQLHSLTAMNKVYQEAMLQIQVRDAQTWKGAPGAPAGSAHEENGIWYIDHPGPWTTAQQLDPAVLKTFVHQAFPGISLGEINKTTVGETVGALNAEKAKWAQITTEAQAKANGFPGDTSSTGLAQVKQRIANINTIVSAYFGYPTSAPAQAEAAYYTDVIDPYRAERTKLEAAASTTNLPTDKLNTAKSALRAWKDEHDHAYNVKFDGKVISFPSPVRLGWAGLPPAIREATLARAAASDWGHIAAYEKDFLGVKVAPDVSKGWALYERSVTAYTAAPETVGKKANLVGLAKKVNGYYPGFYHDWLFAQQPKVTRFTYTTVYKQLPDKAWFDVNILANADKFIKAVKTDKANGRSSATTRDRQWKLFVEEKVMPALIEDHPKLYNVLHNQAGPNFLNTMLSTHG